VADGGRTGQKKGLYEIGEIPPMGHVPENMYAWCIRQERHGAPDTAMQIEVVPTWPIGEDECLVLVMAAGSTTTASGPRSASPSRRIDGHKNPYHIAGSDASGIVWAVGEGEALEAGRRGRHPLQPG
jgi:crotonyl-CoA carboxylase/reductase